MTAGAGGGSNTAPFHVVSVSPSDGSTKVEREPLTIEITFSDRLDTNVVDDSSLRISGPSGAIAGKVEASDDKLTFRPDAPLALLADYTITVGAVRSETRAGLADQPNFRFQTRDGVLGEPIRLWSGGVVNLVRPLGNRAGHVVVSWEDTLTPRSAIVAIFDPHTHTWSEPTTVEDDDVNSQSGRVCLNDSGRVFVTTSSPSRWNRYDGRRWGTASTVGLTHGGSCVLAEDDTAIVSWSVDDDRYAATLSPENKWSAAKTVTAPGQGWGLSPYADGFMAIVEAKDEARLYSYAYNRTQGWLAPKPMTVAGATVNFVSFDTYGSSAVFTWNDASMVKGAVFDGKAWTPHDLGPAPLLFGTMARAGKLGHLVAWMYQGIAYVEHYGIESGWGGPAKLGATNGEVYGPAVVPDDSDNGFAAWVNGTSIDWRRSSHADGKWSELRQIKDQDPYTVWSSVDAAGNVMLIWSNPLGIWASRFE